MTSKEITNASVEDLAKRWWDLYQSTQNYYHYMYLYQNEPAGDIFCQKDIDDFKKYCRKDEKEMRLIEQLRPEVIEYLFGKDWGDRK